jgi:hypothetical protein
MSYQVDPDGNVTFVCQGKDCGKSKAAKSTKVLPKKWCISSVLFSQDHPEFTSAGQAARHAEDQAKKAMEANENLAGHFCSIKCARSTFSDPRVVAMVKKLRVTVVIFADCKLMIDGSGDDGDNDDDEEKPVRPKGGGSRDDEPVTDDSPKGINRPGSPPPFTLPESAGGGI